MDEAQGPTKHTEQDFAKKRQREERKPPSVYTGTGRQ